MSGSSGEYFVDTNVFLRVLVRDEEKSYRECINFLQKVKEGRLKAYTSSLVLAETHWTLASFYQFSKEKIIEALWSIISLRKLKIVDEHNLLAALNFYETNTVKFIDALTASQSLVLKKGAVVVSYDKDFDKLDIPRKEPGEINSTP